MSTSAPEKKSTLKEFFGFIFLVVVIVLPIRFFIAQPFIVNGKSMSPTFESNQYLIVDQLSYKFNSPNRGDVIVFKYPVNPKTYFIKRIIGLPGETISISGQEVTIKNLENPNGYVLDEPFIKLNKEDLLEAKLDSDQYFVMGDNRSESLDSRIWGPLNKDLILGRALVRLWPFNKINFLPGKFSYKI